MAIIFLKLEYYTYNAKFKLQAYQTRNIKYEPTLANRSTCEKIEPLKLAILAQVTHKIIS
jgi:hypothetical protein